MYAGSHDSYKVFGPLFDPIISQYHGVKSVYGHQSDLDESQLKNLNLQDEDKEFVRSTRISVARNLNEMPLGPGMTKEKRLEIELNAVAACSTLQGDLSGTYKSLGEL